MFRRTKLFITVPIAALAGCSTVSPNLPKGAAAYEVIPAASNTSAPREDYRIGPLDVLSINVFQEPDLSFKEIQVDASGNILLPLVGDVKAAGQSARSLSQQISQKLNRYLVNPQVSVVIASSISQHITVEGNVTQPGTYDFDGSTTLLQALAQAKSPTRVAKLNEVVVFRFMNGKRYGAVFDVSKIRAGASPDPALRGGDIVVVNFSAVKGAFRDFLTTAPFFAIFRQF